jgi:hypothetical protein
MDVILPMSFKLQNTPGKPERMVCQGCFVCWAADNQDVCGPLVARSRGETPPVVARTLPRLPIGPLPRRDLPARTL